MEFKRARVVSKGGAIEYVYWGTATARLLPRMIGGRASGPGRRLGGTGSR